jgi:hypothetical protein
MSASGAILHTANLNNAESIRAAMDGLKDVEQLIYSSVARTGDHLDFPGWNGAGPMAWYWTKKRKD